MNSSNIFEKIPGDLPNEVFETIVNEKKVRIERIISKGHASPDNFWYDQPENEWIIVLKGGAELIFEEGNRTIRMEPGDYINISAHAKHRVESTDKNTETIWLAVFY